MTQRYDLRIKLIAQSGTCPNGHRVGDEFFISSKTPEGLCMGAFASLLPYITTLRFGGSFPWEPDKDVARFCCPDPNVCNIFQLERVKRAQEE